MAKATYNRLEEVIRSFGFTLREVKEKNKVYHHEGTGALVVFPEFPPDDPVLPRHILAARSILRAYGIANPEEFTSQLQKTN